jgi:hypothetical protein
MGMLSMVFGVIGGVCAILGIVTVFDVLPPLGAELTWTFWFALSAILLLISIAFGVQRGGEVE